MKQKIKLRTIEVDGQTKQIETKSFQVAKFVFPEDEKAADGQKGVFEAYVSVFGNVDSYGEVVDKGAFNEWLKDWTPRYPKVVRDHDWSKPIAKILEIKEDEIGLKVKAQLLLEIELARETYILMKEGVLTDFSFGYSVVDDYQDPATGARHLRKLAIWECSPVLVGANRSATLTGVKSADGSESEPTEPEATPEPPVADPEPTPEPAPADGEGKAGAVLSKKNRALVETARDALNALLDASEDDGKSDPVPAAQKAIKVLFQ